MKPIDWDQYNYAASSNLVKGNHFSEYPYWSRSVVSWGDASSPYGPDVLYSSFLNRTLSMTNQVNLVNNKAIDKVIDQLAAIPNLFEAWYERKDALDMIGRAGKGIMNFLKNWRKPKYWRSLRTGVKKPEALPEAWLAYNFGLAPLISSIDDALHLLCNDLPVVMVRGTSMSPIVDSESFSGDYNGWSRNGTFKYLKSYRAYVTPELNANASLLNTFGITSPLSTGFSVLPWGWAVNYFVNVSQVLSNFEDKFPGVQLKEVWSTVFITGGYTYEYWHNNVTYGGPKFYSYNGGTVSKTIRSQDSLTYSLTVNLPILGSSKFANLFSAIALTLKGKS